MREQTIVGPFTGEGDTGQRVADLERSLVRLNGEVRRTRRAAKFRNLYDAAGSSRARKDQRDRWRGMFGVEFDATEQENARSLSRLLYRNSSAYRAPLRAAVDEIIGDGLLPIGMNEAAQTAVAMFREWFLDKDRVDIKRMKTGPQLQREAMLAALRDGDELELFTTRGSLQQIGAHRIVQPKRQVNRPHLAGGVETDAFGAPVAYWIAPWMDSGVALDYHRARAYPAAFASLLNCPEPDFEGVRTPPLLIAAMLRVQDVEGYTDKVTVAAKWAAAISGFITTGDASAVDDAFANLDADETGQTRAADDDERVLTDGTFLSLPDGADIRQVQAQQPMASFDAFIQSVLRIACAGVGLPYEIALLDYSRANFSVSRQVQMQAERFAAPWRRMFVERRLLPEYRWKLAEWIGRGLLPSDPAWKRAAMEVQVPPPPHRVIDPQKEHAATVMALQNNLTTLEEHHASRGRDYRQVLEQRAREIRLMRELGVPTAAAVGPGSPGAPQPDNDGLDNEGRRDPTDPSPIDGE